MLSWGWRIPFLLAAGTAVLGYFMRRGLPEPKAFLAAARAERAAAAAAATEAPATDGGVTASVSIASPADAKAGKGAVAAADSSVGAGDAEDAVDGEAGALSALRGNCHSKVRAREGWCGPGARGGGYKPNPSEGLCPNPGPMHADARCRWDPGAGPHAAHAAQLLGGPLHPHLLRGLVRRRRH